MSVVVIKDKPSKQEFEEARRDYEGYIPTLNDCFLDLQRAATALYLNPQGKTHLVFLKHAKKILREQGIERFNADLDCVEKMLHRCRDDVAAKKVADKILTLGLLMRGHPY